MGWVNVHLWCEDFLILGWGVMTESWREKDGKHSSCSVQYPIVSKCGIPTPPTPPQERWTWPDWECQCFVFLSKRNSRQHAFLTLLNALYLVASRAAEVCTSLTFQINVGGRNHDGTMLHLLFHSFKPFRIWDLTSPVMIMTTTTTTTRKEAAAQQQE